MKHFLLFAGIYFAAMTNTATAHIWRVNSDATMVPDFTTIAAAVTAAAAGDTIYVEASGTAYPSFTLNKRLVILGNGYFLQTGTPTDANLEAIRDSSLVSSMFIDSSSVTSNASGSFIAGLSFAATVNMHDVSNITLARCRFSGPLSFVNYDHAGANINIIQSFIENGVTSSGITSNIDIAFQYDIFSAATGMGSSTINLDTHCGGLFRNNTYNNNTPAITLNNFYISNNIFTSANMIALNGTNNTIHSNQFAAITVANIQPGSGLNFTGAIPDPEFKGSITLGYGDTRFQLKNTSFFRNAGEELNGIIPDQGAYNLITTTDTYRNSGLPPIPVISQMDLQSLHVPSPSPGLALFLTIFFSTRPNN